MRTNKEKDRQIKIALSQQVDKIEPSKDLLSKIKKDIFERESEVSMRNNKIGFKEGKRLAVIATCCLLLGSITVLGVTMGKSWIANTQIKYTSFPSQETVLEDVGFIPKYTKTLPEGFEYSTGGIGEATLTDGGGNVLTKTKQVTFSYTRKNEKARLVLNVEQIDEAFLDNEESQFVGELDGIRLYYYEKDYKFVPENYELTEEDKRATEKGELEISYGASEISVENIQALSWYEEGLSYGIIGNDFNFSVEQLVEIAKVIIYQ